MDRKKSFQANGDQEKKKKTRIAILISDKIEFKLKIVKKSQRSLCDDKSVNTSIRYNNYKYLSAQERT